MAKSYNQKAKILYLAQMLRESGENRVFSMQEILSGLMEYGIKAERKSIYDDIETLRDFGMDVRFKRGRSGGYFLAGQQVQMPEEEEKPVDTGEEFEAGETMEEVSEPEEVPEINLKSEEVLDEPEEETFRENWKFVREETEGGDKPMRLLCSSRVREEVQEYFGRKAEYKEKGSGYFTVTVFQTGNPRFFGWLTAMGKDVHIVKPKKMAQAYREYLKSLAKEYKGI